MAVRRSESLFERATSRFETIDCEILLAYLSGMNRNTLVATSMSKDLASALPDQEELELNSRERPLESEVVTPELLEALRDGSHEAFQTVYVHYRGPIENFLYRLLRSREEAEEIVQNVFMVLWERRAELDPAKNIKTLLYTIARNAVINLFKRQKVFERYQQQRDPDDKEHLTAEDILIAQERELLIELTVKNMSSMRRKIFEMSRQQNLSHEEIAQHLEIFKHNVANHLSQALKKIRHVLKAIIVFIH